MDKPKIRKTKLTNYSYIHQWNNKYYPKKGVCEHCGDTEKKHDWALRRDKEHCRGIENYIELCRKCHINYDKTEEWVRKSREALSKTYSHQNPVKEKRCEYCNNSFLPARKERRFCSNSCSKKARKNKILYRDNKGKIISKEKWLALNKK